jgi:hypothetical protein
VFSVAGYLLARGAVSNICANTATCRDRVVLLGKRRPVDDYVRMSSIPGEAYGTDLPELSFRVHGRIIGRSVRNVEVFAGTAGLGF